MLKRILAIAFIFCCTAVAWGILGATIMARTQSASSGLRGKVSSTWGGPHRQLPAEAIWYEPVVRKEQATEDGKTVIREKEAREKRELPLESTRVNAGLRLEHRQKGLMWYSTYAVDFAGAYRFRNPSAGKQVVRFTLHYPAASAVYDGLEMSLNGKPAAVRAGDGFAWVEAEVGPGETPELAVKYRSQGLDRWSYAFGEKVAEAKDFTLLMRTNFASIDFPENTLSPTSKKARDGGWDLEWRYSNLLSGFPIAMAMPEKLQPGPLAGEISFFAPVSLFFYFFVLFLITTLRRIDVHPMNYFFIACAFFAFHLLMAYLVDHISIHLAFAISAVVSLALAASYLRLVVGSKFALREAALTQFIYLVLFSYAFFFRGYTGLTITIGSILTLFVAMQVTGRVKWDSIGKQSGGAVQPS